MAGFELYTGLTWKDISAIAKDINRSPKRVREAIESLVKKITKGRSHIGRLALGISILSLISSLGAKIKKLGNMAKVIASCTVDALVSGVKWLLEKGAKMIIKAIPAIGAILSIFLNRAFSKLVDWFFSRSLVQRVKKKVESKIRPVSYKLIDYFTVFFKSLI